MAVMYKANSLETKCRYPIWSLIFAQYGIKRSKSVFGKVFHKPWQPTRWKKARTKNPRMIMVDSLRFMLFLQQCRFLVKAQDDLLLGTLWQLHHAVPPEKGLAKSRNNNALHHLFQCMVLISGLSICEFLLVYSRPNMHGWISYELGFASLRNVWMV